MPDQQPDIYPGFAIFRFPAGITEIVIRISVVIMLIACLVTSAIALTTNDIIGSSVNFEKYYNFLLATITAIWVGIVTIIALILELLYFVLRFLNIRCYNNCYVVYGILDIIRYVLLVICLLFGVAGYATDSDYARDSADSCDQRSESTGEVDTACEELRDRATVFTVSAVFCGLSIVIIGVAVVWEIVYLAAGCNNRLPVPREGNTGNNDEDKL